MNETKITALYERVAVKDRLSEESISIADQKKQLEGYATAHGFGNTVHFTDDGVCGALFGADRPGLARMMGEIESGNVGICLCRDMSRLGRGWLRVGLCIDTMRANGVRLIAINNDYDSNRDEDGSKTLHGILHMISANGKKSKKKGNYDV